jgi:hypothetical protein
MGKGKRKMKIVATVRTFNEAQHIKKFCESYSQFADLILVADGGSTDNTTKLASQYPRVRIRNYNVRVECGQGIWRNPDGPHIQFLVNWAMEEGADWIVHQDCDQRPNKYLKEDVRQVLSQTDKDFLMVTQIFLWGKNHYFPDLSKPEGDNWGQGLWAWRANIGMRIIDRMPHYEFSYDGENSIDISKTGKNLNLLPPYCFMHYGWETIEKADAHIEYYKASGLIPGMEHPLKFGGSIKELEDWMIED